jgi:hypothetical protein
MFLGFLPEAVKMKYVHHNREWVLYGFNWWNKTTSFIHINSLVIYLFSAHVMPIIVLCFVWCLSHRILIHDMCCLLHSMTERSFQRSHDWTIYVEPCLMWCHSNTLLPCIGYYTGCHPFLSLLFRDMLTFLKYHILHIKIKCMKHMTIYTF